MRGAERITLFFDHCDKAAELTGNHIRTIAELVTYRDDALRLVDSDTLRRIYDLISAKFFSQAQDKPRLNLDFRYLTLCVVFLLRRRIFDDSFLPPEDELSVRVKTACLRVIERRKAAKVHIWAELLICRR